MNKEQMLELLKKDVVPALGCTEPVCVALCAAKASEALKGEYKFIDVKVNTGIYKNGMSAGIPNCNEVGLEWAAALGACLKNSEKSLELLADITPEILEKAGKLIEKGAVNVSLAENEKGLYVESNVTTDVDEGKCVIRNAHTNVVLIKKNEEVLFQKENVQSNGGDDPVVDELKEMKISEIRALVSSATEVELEFLLDGVEMNERLAAYSGTDASGVGIADSFKKSIDNSLMADDLMSKILLKVSAAAENRLDGCPLPTMSSSGAGTKGLVVILPVNETAKAISATKEQEVKALAFAHLVNRYINAHVGKLSPMCSCVMASSTAAAAGITYLLGGTDEQIGYAIRNMSGTVTGMICDGGKVGCALKVSTGSAAALLSAITAVNDAPLRVRDGICAETPEDCIRNMARVGNKGMENTDREILSIMIEKNGKSFDAFDTKKIDEYATQAKASWGKTEAYKEFEEKTKDRSVAQTNEIAAKMMVLFEEFGQMLNLEPGCDEVQNQVKKLQDYITENFYTCTKEILAGLGKMYAGGGSMTENIDKAGGEGTAEFVAKAIEIYSSCFWMSI